MPYSLEDIALIEQSAFFDDEWYISRYADVRLLQMRPAEHYLWLGFRLNRDPSTRFSTKGYLSANPDVNAARINPLLHFIKDGQREGRLPLPDSDAFYFISGRQTPVQGFPNILLCAHDVNMTLFGGERSFLDILAQIERLQINIYVTIPKDANPDYLTILRRKSCGIFQFYYHQWQNERPTQINTVSWMEYILNAYDIDIVYTNTIFLRDFQYVAKSLGRKSFCHLRELIGDDAALREKIGLETTEIIADLWERSDFLIANSRRTQELFAGALQPIYAPNIVDCSEFDFANPVSLPIVFAIISSNAVKKGIADFVKVAKLCVERAPSAQFWIIGPRNTYIEDLEHEGFPGNLHLKGYAATPQEALSGVNVLLSLSHFAESFGRTIAEAQAARRPVIAYDWGAVPELIEDGVTGFLVPYLSVEAAAQAVQTLCDHPSRIKAMGEAGREKMLRGYAPEVLGDALRQAFSHALERDVDFRIRSASKKITVIIPVYKGYNAVKRCLESVEAWTTSHLVDVLIVDDGSPDPAIPPMLARFGALDRFKVVRNDGNLGYTRTINKAIKLCAPNDIILLNSDTVVTPGWVEGLHDTVYTSNRIGTATAMGDNAGAFSFPRADHANPMPSDASHALWATTLIRAAAACEPVEVPTGNGFCIFIRRALIDEIGLFDEELFPRGYGEENDFCMRAKAAGWKNLISPKAYIFHERSVSFGAEKTKLIENATRVIAERHPTYYKEVEAAFSSDAISRLRAAVACVADFDARGAASVSPSVRGGSPAAKFVRLNETLINWSSLVAMAPARRQEITSIIICVRNNPEQIDRCVRSIMGAGRGEKVEVILVDNGSDSHVISTLDALCDEFLDVRTICNHEDLHFSLASNIGFTASIGARVVFLDGNSWVTENWLTPLVASLESEFIKGAQPRFLNSDGTTQSVGFRFSTRDPLGPAIDRDKPNSAEYAGKQRWLQAVSGACMAMRATDFANARGFDAIFIDGQEDIDLCLRLSADKPSFVYVPNSTVYRGEDKAPETDRYGIHNRTELFMRWQNRIVSDQVLYSDE